MTIKELKAMYQRETGTYAPETINWTEREYVSWLEEKLIDFITIKFTIDGKQLIKIINTSRL